MENMFLREINKTKHIGIATKDINFKYNYIKKYEWVGENRKSDHLIRKHLT